MRRTSESDAVSAYTQVKMEGPPKLLKTSGIGMPGRLDSSSSIPLTGIIEQKFKSQTYRFM